MAAMRARRRSITPTLLFLPAFLLLVLFWCVPLIPGLALAFQPSGTEGAWPSVVNYARLLGEQRFRHDLFLSLVYVVGVVGSSIPVAYGASLLMTVRARGFRWSRGLLLLPWAVPPVVTALIFRNLAWGEGAPLTTLYRVVSGQNNLLPLQDSSWAMATVVLHSFWRSVPVMTLFLAAGMTTIPKELHEAAQTDGATPLQRFQHITFPLTRMHLAVGMLLITAFSLQDAETVYALTGGGPHYGTEVTAVRLFKEAFDYGQFPVAAAIGSFLLALGLCFMLLYLTAFRRAEVTV